MTFKESREIILELLRRNGKAKNSEMLALLNGDEKLLDQVREDLLFTDMADDKKGIGLIYIGDDSPESKIVADTIPKKDSKSSDSPKDPTGIMFIYDVFLSFSSQDADLAKRIYDILCEHNLKVFWSPVSLRDRAGVFWFEELGKALEQARHLVVLLSENALVSPYVKLEYMTFYSLMLSYKGRLLFPVYEEGLNLKELPVFLKQLQGYSLNKTQSVPSVIAILTGIISEVTIGMQIVQTEHLENRSQKWFVEKRWKDNKGITYMSMQCHNCGNTLGSYSADYLPAEFCPHCRARKIGQSVDIHDASRRPARPKLPLYDLAIAGVEPFAKRAFSNEPFEPGPHYAAYESSVQEIMVRLELGEQEASIVGEFEEKRKKIPAGDYSLNSMRFWRIQEAVRDAKALLALNFKSFPLLEAKEQPSSLQQYPDRPSPDAWYRVHRVDLYDDEWECKACGNRGPNYMRGAERPPKFCPYCGSEKSTNNI